jgi:S1-C subfamily serine protease
MIVQRISAVVVVAMIGMSAFGQTPQPAQTPRRPTPPAQAITSPPAPFRKTSPQVVTVLHRLNGLKMFRLLLHSGQGVEAIANLDETFNLMDDVHTNVIAGLALDDGDTIAARLPEVEVEATGLFDFPRTPLAPAVDPLTHFRGSFIESPDLTVIDSDGKRMSAQFVGVDGATGLSILKISGRLSAPPPPKDDNLIGIGGGVRLLGPEPAPPKRFGVTNVYVRMGESSGTISNVLQAPSGDVARFKIRSGRLLSQANVGGIAVNATGETIGIIDSVEGTEASILPAALVRRAAKRVLASQASVPRPWLGVKGDPIASLEIEQIQKQGWELWRASNLAQAHRGILLTSIAPNSPAALAALRAGDVILKVNDEAIQTADDFSWVLEQAGPSTNVRFTVARPDRNAEEMVSVVLSSSPKKPLTFASSKLPRTPRTRWLVSQGIETIALRPVVATQLGATPGLLVVYVEPGTLAFEAGLQPGDVIETIDGTAALRLNGGITPFPSPTATPVFEVVRKKQKLVISLAKPARKK